LEEKKEYLLNPSSFLTLGITFVFTLFFIFGLGLLFLNSQRYLAEINYYKGISKFQSGQKEQGLKKLEVAVSLNSNSDLYLRQLSQAYLSRLADVVNDKNLSEEEKNQNIQLLVNNAINAGKMSTDASPKNVSNWSIRGYVYQSLIGLVPGAEDWVIKSYDEASALDPKNPYYPTQEGIAYLTKASVIDKDDAAKKNDDLKNAKSLFDKSIGLKSDYAAARFELAMVYQAQGETEQEVQALEDAKKNSPNDIGLLFQIGLVYYQEGNYDKARSNLELAVNNSPDYSNALYFLGLAYSKLGQTQKAIETFQKVAGLNPDNTEIPKIISNLKAGKSALFGIIEETPAQAPVQETPPEKQGK